MKRTGVAVVLVALVVATTRVVMTTDGRSGNRADWQRAEQRDRERSTARLEAASTDPKTAQRFRVTSAETSGVSASIALSEPVGSVEDGLEVLAVDREGFPVPGVDVVLVRRLSDDVRGLERVTEIVCSRSVTNQEGRAWLVEGDASRSVRERAERLVGAVFDFSVEADSFPPDHSAVRVGHDLESAGPVRLVLGAFGSIRLVLKKPEDSSVPSRCHAYYRFRKAGSTGAYEGSRRIVERMQAGVGMLEAVPLGQEFWITIEADGRVPEATVGLGPSEPGEMVEMEVALGERAPILRGVLSHAGRQPRPAERVRVAIVALRENAAPDYGPKSPKWRWADVEADGSFELNLIPAELQLQLSIAPGAMERQLYGVFLLEPARSPHFDIERVARWSGTLALSPAAVNDLGQIELTANARRLFLAAGRVRSDDGQPLGDVALRVSQLRDGRLLRRPKQISTDVDDDGYFEVYVDKELPAVARIRAEAEGWISASVDVVSGQRGAELVLERGGGLAGRFLVGEKVGAQFLSWCIEGEGVTHRSTSISFGEFRVDGLPPGMYSVAARVGTWTLGVLENVWVPRGGVSDDPRLQRIDISGESRVLRLVLLGPDGEPLVGRWADVRDSEGMGGRFSISQTGAVLALVPANVAELKLSVNRVHFDGPGSPGGSYVGSWSTVAGYTGTVTLH